MARIRKAPKGAKAIEKFPFRIWRERMEWTQKEAADALDITPRMIQLYEKGTHRVPLTVQYAMTALYHRLQPWIDGLN